MPLFSDLQKIFFGAKSVAKHQAERAGEAARETAGELKEQGDELFDLTKQAARDLAQKAPGYIAKGKQKLDDLGDRLRTEADELGQKAKQTSTSAQERYRAATAKDTDFDFGDLDLTPESKAPKSGSIDFEEGLTETPPPTSREPSEWERAADDTLDSLARTGVRAKEKAGELGEKALNRAAELGAGLKAKTDAFVDHANRKAEKMRMEEAIENAKRAAEQAEARARAFDQKETSRDTSDSVLDGTDSFFERADRFARGDYHNEGGKDVRIKEDPDYRKPEKSNIIDGFGDADGDGDSLIDDAILDEDDDTLDLLPPPRKD